MKKSPKRPRSTRSKVLRVVRWLLVVGLVGALVLAGGLFYLYKTTDIPDPNKDFQTQTSFVYYNDGTSELGQYATQNRESISLKTMPDTMKDAVVAAENKTFWTDSGIDPKGIVRAAFSNASGNSTQGASTITQQFVKILYLNQERSYSRKLKEAILSLKIQRQLSKSEILEGYLNTIYFGRGAYGVQAASQAYFDVDAKDLTLRQSAVLASVLNNPTQFDPANGKSSRASLAERYRYTLGNMADQDMVPAATAEKAAKRLPKFPDVAVESTYGGQRGHMLELVKDELHAMGYDDEEIDGGGLRVTTTFTKKAMDAAAAGVKEVRPDISDRQLHIAVASVEPGTGALRGFYGGQNYLRSQINWAVAGGMVGSTFKPISLATGLEQGYSLRDTFDGNSPFDLPGVSVQNEGAGTGNNYGSVSLLTATEESINTAYVDMSDSLTDGPAKIAATANKLGIPPAKKSKKSPGIPDTSTDFSPEDALITLGKARISPINMANTYASIANGGKRADVHVIDKIVDRNGEELYSAKQSTTQAIPEDIAADTSYALQQTVQNGTGANALALGRPAGGKTGTATNGKDQVSSSWFVGYTPQLATAVMYVRGDGDDQLDDDWLPSYNGVSGYFGSNYPTRTWTAVMSRDMEGLDVEDFPPPAYVDGEAPSEGHAPYVAPTTQAPAPQPSQPQPTRRPTKQPTKQPTVEPAPTKTPEPTRTPQPSNTPEPSTPPTTPTSPAAPTTTAPPAAGGANPKP